MNNMKNFDKLLKETLSCQQKIKESIKFFKENQKKLISEQKDKLIEINDIAKKELEPELKKLINITN